LILSSFEISALSKIQPKAKAYGPIDSILDSYWVDDAKFKVSGIKLSIE